jgi:hypothetical protein
MNRNGKILLKAITQSNKKNPPPKKHFKIGGKIKIYTLSKHTKVKNLDYI